MPKLYKIIVQTFKKSGHSEFNSLERTVPEAVGFYLRFPIKSCGLDFVEKTPISQL